MSINVTEKAKKKLLLQNFFTGRKKALSKAENDEIIKILMSESVQKEFCQYLIHTGKY